MNRGISTERLYSLGDFRNIKFSDTITDIPEDVALNSEAMGLLHYLQLLEIEGSYTKYANMARSFASMSPDEILEFIESQRTTTFDNLLRALHKGE